MNESWLQTHSTLDASKIERRVDEQLSPDHHAAADDAQRVASELRSEMIGDQQPASSIFLTADDCDIVPRDYVIDWQHPLLGPINAQVRSVINAEIRRYLAASLEKQSTINRQLLTAVEHLQAENAELRRLLEGKDNFTLTQRLRAYRGEDNEV